MVQNKQKNSRLAFAEAATTRKTINSTDPILLSGQLESQRQNEAPFLNKLREISLFPDKIPFEMRQRNQWILWRLETVSGKQKGSKIPYTISGTRADITNSDHWSSFAEVLQVYENNSEHYSGIGFVFSQNDPYTGIDLDNCIINGMLTDEADEILNALESYSERSQSKAGVHVIVKATIMGMRNRTGNYEVYDRDRFFAITGDRLELSPVTIAERQEEMNALYNQLFGNIAGYLNQKSDNSQSMTLVLPDQDIISIAVKAKNGEKFSALYAGNWESYYTSQSEADQALCNILAFYTKDAEQMDRLFRGSDLMRDKWERNDYRSRTISQALATVTAQYKYKDELKPVADDPDDDLGHLLTEKQAWDVKLSQDALYGLAGEVVELISPHSEADPAALLFNFLTIFGNTVGTWPHFTVSGGEHRMKLNVVLVGPTFSGKKGTSLDPVLRLMTAVDPKLPDRKKSGLSSGEGVIYSVRDTVTEMQPTFEGSGKNRKPTGEYMEVITDIGVEDKRLLIVEGEFGGVLKVLKRDGNTLGAIIRNAWDGNGAIQTMTRQPVSASETHLSILGHITQEELLKLLSDADIHNGLVNRFLWINVKQSKSLPSGGEFHKVDISSIVQRIQEVVNFAQGDSEKDRQPMERDAAANALWEEVYAPLQKDVPGIVGTVISRAIPYCMRIGSIYALLDKSWTVRVEHLKAALALWEFAKKSAQFIFGESNSDFDPVTTKILSALRERPKGLTSTEINVTVFKKNLKSAEIAASINKLSELGLVNIKKVPNAQGKGKATTVIRLVEQA